MRKNASAEKWIRGLEAAAIVVAVFGAFLLPDVFAYGLPILAAQASIGGTVSAIPPAVPAPAIPTGVGTPIRIRIASVGLSAAIEKVGLTRDGSMGVPKLPRDAGWYALGPRPGEAGSAVIAGHVNWLYGATAAFANLQKAKLGDTILVQDDRGVTTVFVIRKIKTYDAASDAAEVFSSQDGKAHLNLITCVVGVWDTRAKQYNKRLVVFADKKAK